MRSFTTYLLTVWATFFLPLSVDAGGPVDIVSFENTLVRFQTPRPGQSTLDARITTLDWPTTEDDVARTINDYFNSNGQNVQLFLQGGMGALNYANYIQVMCMTHQDGLNFDNTVVSILLPSGVAKVSPILASSKELHPGNQKVQGIFGIRTDQPLAPSDWAYTSGALMKKAIAQWEVQYQKYGATQAGVNLIRADGSPVIMTMELVGM